VTRNEKALLAITLVLSSAILTYVWVSEEPPLPPRPTFTGDAAVVERFQCYRCHSAPDHLVAATREQSCVTCHQSIMAGELDDEIGAADVARWQSHLTNLLLVPSLDGLSQRVTAEWMRSFLSAPHDLRPNLPATMPRLRMTSDEIDAVLRHFEVEPGGFDDAPRGDPIAGRARYLALECTACHAYSGASVAGPTDVATDAARLAPDLINARARMTRAMVIAWIESPSSIHRETRMPTVTTTAEDRADLAAFLLDSVLVDDEAIAALARLPILTREVHHAEVDEAVFHRTCRHCHADPIPVGGDGGPGNTGGFGFEGRGFDLSTFEGIDASRAELLAPDESGEPLLLAALLRRHDEVRGVSTERRGMPLALPPISPEALQLVESWIAQGAPR
jgi:cytochrome c5